MKFAYYYQWVRQGTEINVALDYIFLNLKPTRKKIAGGAKLPKRKLPFLVS